MMEEFSPQFSYPISLLIRQLYAILLIATLVQMTPLVRYFLVGSKWNGYIDSTAKLSKFLSPTVAYTIWTIWLLTAAGLLLNQLVIACALINLILCHYFFVQLRWKSLLRGDGAPGYISFWLAALVFSLEFVTAYTPTLKNLTVLVFQIDFAIIMITAGISKITSGYIKNNGMEYGLSNPIWGYWWKFYKKMNPNNPLLKISNFLAWSVEIGAGILMIIPQTRFLGGLAMFLSFIYIWTHIRLGFLCEMICVCCLLFITQNSLVTIIENPLLTNTIQLLLIAYLILRPIMVLGLWYNFYGSKKLPTVLQKFQDLYTNFFGIILWRVFTVDVTNFYVQVSYIKNDNNRIRLSNYTSPLDLRFNNVGEAITVTTIFSTLKYFSNNWELFNHKLINYTKSLPLPKEAHTVVYDYYRIEKSSNEFNHILLADFKVDLKTWKVTETQHSTNFTVRASESLFKPSQVAAPGSYAPSNS